MSKTEHFKAFVSALVILGFTGTFGWALVTTWTQGPGIADAQDRTETLERDQADALRRLEAARRDPDGHNADLTVRREELDAITKEASEARAQLSEAKGVFKPNVNYLATALAGLVGAVVATMFGQSLGKLRAESAPKAATAAPRAAATELVTKLSGWRDTLSSAYSILYFIFGAIAIGTWAFSAFSPEMIKNLATISLTLFLAIARSFFDTDRVARGTGQTAPVTSPPTPPVSTRGG